MGKEFRVDEVKMMGTLIGQNIGHAGDEVA
jgi:hypothetical protein